MNNIWLEEHVANLLVPVKATESCYLVLAQHLQWKNSVACLSGCGWAGQRAGVWICGTRTMSLLQCALLLLSWAAVNVDAVLPSALGLVQSCLNTEVCPWLHWVVFVTLPETESQNLFIDHNYGKHQPESPINQRKAIHSEVQGFVA